MTWQMDLFTEINNAVLDLQSAQLQSYDRPLKRLASLLRHSDLQIANNRLTQGCDIDTFLAGQKRSGGIGGDHIDWPSDPEQVLGLTLLLIEKFAADPRYMVTFGHTYYRTDSNKIMASVNAVTGQVIIPFVRDYRAYVNAYGNIATRLTIITNNKVFVVHGHDVGAREGVARFLENLGLEPVILQEQPNSGQTIIEKFEAHAATVNFAVILLTPDDLGASGEAERARQNVIYELGYFTGRLGRGRACLLRRGNVDMPSDLAGVIYTELDAVDGWKLKLVKELKAAGFSVDPNMAMK